MATGHSGVTAGGAAFFADDLALAAFAAFTGVGLPSCFAVALCAPAPDATEIAVPSASANELNERENLRINLRKRVDVGPRIYPS